MSKPDSPNPYESPRFDPQTTTTEPFAEEVPFEGKWTMDYTGGFNLIHANPNWLTNCFMIGLCGIIPIAGGIVLLGYFMEVAELLHRSNGRRYWDFNFNRFGEYLSRGIGPFLIYFLVSMFHAVMNLVIQFGLMFAFAGGLGAVGGGGQGQVEMAINMAMLVSYIINFGTSLFFLYLYVPGVIRSGLSREIGDAFHVGKNFEFAGKVWLEILLAALFSMLVWIPVALAGFMACCVGILASTGYMTIQMGWFSFQLYRLYLSRGGKPIPLKPLPTSV